MPSYSARVFERYEGEMWQAGVCLTDGEILNFVAPSLDAAVTERIEHFRASGGNGSLVICYLAEDGKSWIRVVSADFRDARVIALFDSSCDGSDSFTKNIHNKLRRLKGMVSTEAVFKHLESES